MSGKLEKAWQETRLYGVVRGLYLVIENTLFQQHKEEDPTHGHHQMNNAEIRPDYILFGSK